MSDRRVNIIRDESMVINDPLKLETFEKAKIKPIEPFKSLKDISVPGNEGEVFRLAMIKTGYIDDVLEMDDINKLLKALGDCEEGNIEDFCNLGENLFPECQESLRIGERYNRLNEAQMQYWEDT